MAISRPATGGADADSATISGVSEDDLVLVFAIRQSSAAIPSLPSDWNSAGTVQAAGAGTDLAMRVGWRYVPAAGLTSTDTWTNATRVLWVALRGTHDVDPIGNVSLGGDTEGDVDFVRYRALTLSVGRTGQWLLACAGRPGAGLDADMDNAIAGMTLIHERPSSAGTDAALYSTEAPRLTDWPDTDNGGFGVSTQFVSAVVEVFEFEADDSSDNPEAPELSVTSTDVDAFMAIDGFHPVEPADIHQQTTWQIALASDPSFSNPIVEVESSTYLLAYNALGVLTPSTDYIARARTRGIYANGVSRLRLTCRHEGAHAVVGAVLNVPIDYVEVGRLTGEDGGQKCGITKLSGDQEALVDGLPATRQALVDKACVCAAGIASEILLETGPDGIQRSASDMLDVRAIAEVLGADPVKFYQSMINQAASILRSPAGRPAWDRVSMKLERRRRLSGPEVVALVSAGHPGGNTSTKNLPPESVVM